MNIKRIWMMSLILGTMVAVIAYVTMFSGNVATKTSSDAAQEQQDLSENQNKDLKSSEDEVGEIPKREKVNPIAEIT